MILFIADGIVVSSMQVLCASYTDEEFFKYKCFGNFPTKLLVYVIFITMNQQFTLWNSKKKMHLHFHNYYFLSFSAYKLNKLKNISTQICKHTYMNIHWISQSLVITDYKL